MLQTEVLELSVFGDVLVVDWTHDLVDPWTQRHLHHSHCRVLLRTALHVGAQRAFDHVCQVQGQPDRNSLVVEQVEGRIAAFIEKLPQDKDRVKRVDDDNDDRE